MSENLPSSDQIAFAEWFTKKSYSKDEKTCLLANRVMDREKALRSSLDAANRALAEEQKRSKQYLIDIDWLEERISMDDSGAALVEAQEALTEVRDQLAAAEKMKCFWPKGCSDSARCKENGSCVAQDQRDGFRMQRTIDAAVKLATPDVESLTAQLTEVRAKLEAAEKERDESRKFLEIVNLNARERMSSSMQTDSKLDYAAGQIVLLRGDNETLLHNLETVRAQLTAAQADVARLTEEQDQAIKCAKGWIDEFYRIVGERDSSLSQFTAAASREAALVEERDDLKNHFTENSLRGQIESAATRETALVKALEALKAGVVEVLMPAVNSAIKSGYVITMFSPEDMQWAKAMELTDAALARCSPPAAETET